MKTYKRFEVEAEEKWAEKFNQIPFLRFKEGWKVSIIPPFGGAIARFRVKEKNTTQSVSVYLDWFDNLGCVGEPYWEVYPVNGDCSRCLLNETEDLIDLITQSLKEIE